VGLPALRLVADRGHARAVAPRVGCRARLRVHGRIAQSPQARRALRGRCAAVRRGHGARRRGCPLRRMSAAIDVRCVAKRYGSFEALRGVSLSIEQGEFFGLLGPNGAGKTTLISIVAGLTRASSGEATVMGHDVVRDFRAARRALGVVPQEPVFDPFFTVRETLRITSGYY